MGRTIYIHGPPQWIHWAGSLIESTSKILSLEIQVVTPSEPLSARDFLRVANVDSFAIIFIDNPRNFIFEKIAKGSEVFREVVRQEIAKAVLAYEISRQIPHVIIDLADVSLRGNLVDLILNAVTGKLSVELSVACEPPPIQYTAHEVSDEIVAEIDRVVDACLEPLLFSIRDSRPVIVHWPRELFFAGDAPGTQLPAVIEIAGGGRILSYGPYLMLPSGAWRIDIVLGFSSGIHDMLFLIEMASEEVLFRGYIQVVQGGIFSTSFDALIDRTGMPLEIRIISQEAVFEGRMSLIDVTFFQLTGEGETSTSRPPLRDNH